MSVWHRWGLAAALAALAVAYTIAFRAPAVGAFHDDGVYIVTAKALAEGKGYRIISLPSEIPQTKYPALFPILLAGVWKWNPNFPENVPFLKLIPLLSTILWLGLSYRLLREEGVSKPVAAWICCLTAASTWVVYLGTMVLSEAPFAALTTASLLAFRRAERSGSTRLLLLSAVCAALAFHTRTLGLGWILAGALYLALGRRWRQAFLFAAVASLLAAPWIWWVASQPPPIGAVDAYYSKENYQGWNILSNFTLSQKLTILFSNLTMVLFAPGLLAGIPANGWLALAALAVGVATAAGMWKLRSSVFVLLFLVYGSMVCAWAWIPSRFVVPFLPLMLWLAWQSLEKYPRARLWSVGLLTIASALSLSAGIQSTLRLGYPPLPTPAASTDGWDRQEALLERIRRQTPPNAVLIGNLDPLYYLYTGRKAVRGFAAKPFPLFYSHQPEGGGENPIGGPSQLLQSIQASGATYWVDSPNSAFAEGPHLKQAFEQLRRRYPQAIVPLATLSPTHTLFQLRLESQALAAEQ
ncbi:MAG: glycosyltransferase family 39 protein [Acidobacteria bacterium]|nr:glycosyltransferase family 39 protein [Acidobacteriota bacterium]